MSFWWVFFITEWNYDGCWTRGEWIETGHSSRTFMFSTSISWTKPSSVHNPNLPKGNVFFRHHCERQHKTTKLFTVQYVGYMLLYAISRLAFLAVVQSCLPIRTRQGSWTKTMRWKNPRWSKPKFFRRGFTWICLNKFTISLIVRRYIIRIMSWLQVWNRNIRRFISLKTKEHQ